MSFTPELTTDRLTLKPLRLEDAPAIQRRFTQWEVVRWLNGRIPWPLPPDSVTQNVQDAVREMAEGKAYYWCLWLKGGPDEAIGRIDLRLFDGQNRDQRGFWIDPEFQGAGLMTEAAQRVTKFAFESLGWTQLYLTNAVGNAASHRIKEKQGAKLIDREPFRWVSGEGEREVWLLNREEWLERFGAD